MHGRRLDLYRSFPNLSCTANLAIHCWLLSLEKILEKEGKIPDILTHEVNMKFAPYFFCALMVVVVIFSRLMVALKTLQKLPWVCVS